MRNKWPENYTETTKKPEHKSNIKPTPQRGFQKGSSRPPRISERWEGNTVQSFNNWLEDVKPKILTRSGRYEVFNPTPEQEKQIQAIFKTDDLGDLIHSLCLEVQPRRHGKSTVFALVVLFFFTARKNFLIQLLGNTEHHSMRTQFRPLMRIVKHTPELMKRITEKGLYLDHMVHPTRDNIIQMSRTSTSTAFGEKIDLLWVSDMHASPDLAPFNALQASLLDSENSLILIDSNADPLDGPVHELEKEADEDESIYANHIEYESFEEFCEKAPAWIDRKKAERLKKTTLPVDFERDILGKRSSATNALFPPYLVKQCKDSYKIPVLDIETLAKGRSYKVGGGLDRSKKILAGSQGDHTVWTVILKVANAGGEPEIFMLNQVRFTINTSKAIKAQILQDHKRYHLDNVVLENYEVSDLLAWCNEQQIPTELISATDSAQNASFPEMHRIFKEGRFHIPENVKVFEDELSTFVYTQKKTAGTYTFGHSSQKFHDDTIYSTNWAIFALRSFVLDMYNLGCIMCKQRNTVKRSLCFLMGGSRVLYCSEQCHAFHEIQDFFKHFKSIQLDSELNIIEFYHAYVSSKNSIITYQQV